MAKGKKKKKDLDFQKVKLKVGRKLKRDSNETKAEFKTRKIILKEVKNYSDDPLGALARHGDHISQHGKLSMLNHFNSALNAEIVKSLNKPILDGLSKFIIDHSEQVRGATIKCLKNCFNHIRQQHLSTKDFILSLKPYLDCAYTHVSSAISSDCLKFLDYFVNINDPQTFETLMTIILRRYEAGNLNTSDKKLALKLKNYYLRYKQKKNVDDIMKGDGIVRLIWTKTNNLIDLDYYKHDFHNTRLNPEKEVLLYCANSTSDQEDMIERYLAVIRDDA